MTIGITLIAIDPGNENSAIVWYDPHKMAVLESRYEDNESALTWLRQIPRCPTLIIEMIASYGMPVGREVFETCVWVGRFLEAWGSGSALLYRKDVKLHLCGSARAKDGHVRAALLDKFGGVKAARGTRKAQGPLYGIAGDKWAALGVAVTWAETQRDLVAGAAA